MSTHTCVLTATTFDGRPSRPCEACAAGVNNYVDGREAGLREALEVAERLRRRTPALVVVAGPEALRDDFADGLAAEGFAITSV